MLQLRVFSRPLRRATLAILLAGLLAGCSQGAEKSALPIRELGPPRSVPDYTDRDDSDQDDIGYNDIQYGDIDQAATLAGLAGSEVTAATQDSVDDCRTVFNPEQAEAGLEQTSPLRLILDSVEVAKADDERCGPRPTEEIYCRALWLLEVLDPVVLGLDETILVADEVEAATALDWALSSAIDAPREPDDIVGNAFAQLRPLTSALVTAMEGVDPESQLTIEHEQRLALLLEARAHPLILEPLSAMQNACLLGS